MLWIQLAFEVPLGNRYEPRTPAGLQVKVHGIDLHGNPFKQSAQAQNVSSRGACLDGIGCLRGPGETIEIEYRGKRARFVVAWVGIPGTPEHNRIGVKNKDGQDIWKLDLPRPEPDRFEIPSTDGKDEPSEPSSIQVEKHLHRGSDSARRDFADIQGTETPERRRYRRYAINGSATLQVKDLEVRTWGKLSDASPGGCYVESYAPFPAGTELQMTLEVDEVRVAVEGIVKVVYPSLGMGIEFTNISSEHKRQLERLTSS